MFIKSDFTVIKFGELLFSEFYQVLTILMIITILPLGMADRMYYGNELALTH